MNFDELLVLLSYFLLCLVIVIRARGETKRGQPRLPLYLPYLLCGPVAFFMDIPEPFIMKFLACIVITYGLLVLLRVSFVFVRCCRVYFHFDRMFDLRVDTGLIVDACFHNSTSNAKRELLATVRNKCK